MTKLIISKFLLCFFIFSLCISVAKGEDYVSKSFPPKEILVKAMVKLDPREHLVFTYIGKIQDKDGNYSAYFSVYKNKEDIHDPYPNNKMVLFKLDTDLWLFFGPNPQEVYILQK